MSKTTVVRQPWSSVDLLADLSSIRFYYCKRISSTITSYGFTWLYILMGIIWSRSFPCLPAAMADLLRLYCRSYYYPALFWLMSLDEFSSDLSSSFFSLLSAQAWMIRYGMERNSIRQIYPRTFLFSSIWRSAAQQTQHNTLYRLLSWPWGLLFDILGSGIGASADSTSSLMSAFSFNLVVASFLNYDRFNLVPIAVALASLLCKGQFSLFSWLSEWEIYITILSIYFHYYAQL